MILYRAEAGVARITLNRPEKRNALNAELIATLHESLARSARDREVKVVVISGAGTGLLFRRRSCRARPNPRKRV